MDYGLMNQMEPESEEQGILLKRARAQIKSPGGTLSNTVQPGQSMLPNTIERLRGRASDMYDRASQMMDQPLDYSGLQAFAKQRGQQGEQAMLNALAAQYAGEQFQPLQQQFMKTAASTQDPIKMGGGLITNTGQFIKDPEVAQDKQVQMLLNNAKAYEQQAVMAETARERIDAQRKHDQTMEQLRLMGLNMQQQGLDLRRQIAANNTSAVGSFAPSGFTPDGQQVVTNSKNGVNYTVTVDASGRPSYAPYMGNMIPKATFEKNVEAARTFGAKASSADALIQQVDANPDAFGIKAAAVSKLPAPVQGRVASMMMDPQTLKLRADVLRQAAMEISDIYGAAQSIGEAARAATFIPNPEDPPEVVIEKLRAARDYARSNAKAMGGAANRAAQDRSDGLNADEQAELAALRAKHRR